LKHNNYIDVVLPFALKQGTQLLGDNFIFQQDSAPARRHYQSQAWCEKHFPDFINKDRWPANSPDLNVLDYYVWDAIGQQMRWNKINNYETLREEIKRAIELVPKKLVASSVDSWSRRILKVLKAKDAYIK
jgi:inhibitor of nuclear factor kappa-B kinase subunit alpha